MGKISILIPFKSDHGPRMNAFKWVKAFYKNTFPNADLCVGYSETKPFSKSQAVNNAAKTAAGDTFIIVDADIICSPKVINDSVKRLNHTPWIIPYSKVAHLNKHRTERLLQTDPKWPLDLNPKDKITKTKKNMLPVGGINILSRPCFEAVGGFDERFIGWGGEDDAFAASLNTICGHYTRLPHLIYHLWHPALRAVGNRHYKANYELALRYCKAIGNKMLMKKIIREKNNLLK
ncbi:glycosyltransferase [Bacillus aquiflavi]|uniref:galactosyltransferase-related protein n=1 Tax=Bacillus aquiflavi TaxID=2672567 RepID=UPI001CA83BB8|nr:galactosyltransferase-related protein [Bacillus aquiflavi]UAC49109.1 glycosyltransferase [Bacillus aquiflavi]